MLLLIICTTVHVQLKGYFIFYLFNVYLAPLTLFYIVAVVP